MRRQDPFGEWGSIFQLLGLVTSQNPPSPLPPLAARITGTNRFRQVTWQQHACGGPLLDPPATPQELRACRAAAKPQLQKVRALTVVGLEHSRGPGTMMLETRLFPTSTKQKPPTDQSVFQNLQMETPSGSNKIALAHSSCLQGEAFGDQYLSFVHGWGGEI